MDSPAADRPEETVDDELAQLTRGYLDSLRSTAAAVRELIASGDHIALRSVAHRTRGAAGMYGFPGLSETAGLLEDAISAGQDEDLILRRADEFVGGIEQILPAS